MDEKTPLSSRQQEDDSQGGDQFPTNGARINRYSEGDETYSVQLYVLVWIAEIVGILAVILVIIWMSHFRGGFAWDGSGKEFNYHPVFMVVGMVFLYGNAALVYRALPMIVKFHAKLIHMCVQILVMILTVIGLVTVFDFHNANHIPNMYTLHSWVGLFAVVLFFLQIALLWTPYSPPLFQGISMFQFLFGFLAFLLPKFSDEYRAKYLVVHQYFGSAIFILAIGSCLLGITEKLFFSIMSTYKNFVAEGILANTLGLVLIIFGGVVMAVLTKQGFKRKPDSNSYYALELEGKH